MDNANITLPLQELERRFKSVILRLPVLVGNEVVNFALDNFKRQAWLGDTVQPWPRRKNPTKWGQQVKRPGRSLLVDTGRLRRDVSNANRLTTTDSVRIVVSNPYAKAHNEGVRLGELQHVKSFERKVTKVGIVKKVQGKTKSNITFGRVAKGITTVKAHTRRIDQRIPARRFLGNSQYLNARLQRLVSSEIMKAANRPLNSYNYA